LLLFSFFVETRNSGPDGFTFVEHRRLPVSDSPTNDAGVRDCTSRQSNTHSTEKRQVRYRWHPWFGRFVGIEETIEKRTQSIFRCRIEETVDGRALEIPQWMFDPTSGAIELTAEPHVSCAALVNLTALLRGASRYDCGGGEAQHLKPEGGADAKAKEPSTICSIGIVSSAIEERHLGGPSPRNPAKDDTVNRTTIASASGKKHPRSPRRGGRS
jgi:hypothetical protein